MEADDGRLAADRGLSELGGFFAHGLKVTNSRSSRVFLEPVQAQAKAAGLL
jgi:hypothetical protein